MTIFYRFSLLVLCLEFITTTAFTAAVNVRRHQDYSSYLESHNNDIFVISFDGTFADTVDWRVEQGIHAAVRTWPHLPLNFEDTDNAWLCNKMKALSHVMDEPTDYALLARLLIEEQELDQGRSVGLSGKYASKFHPSASSNVENPKQKSNRGSRPLTVGEISANWSDYLRDTLCVKFNIHGESPLPTIKAAIEQLLKDTPEYPLVLNNVVCDALSQCMGHVIVTVGHDSELQFIEQKLVHIPKLSLVAAQTLSIHQLLLDAPKDSTVHVIHSHWKTLLHAKSYFGDDIPRRGQVSAPARFGDMVHLSLHLWVDSKTHISQHNNALMDPWTNLMSEDQFTELVSARILSTREIPYE